MAKRVVAEAYTFSPGTNTITVTGKWIRREQIILILNVTSNTVIYNFRINFISFFKIFRTSIYS